MGYPHIWPHPGLTNLEFGRVYISFHHIRSAGTLSAWWRKMKDGEMKDYDPQANQIKVANMSKDIISMKDTMSSMGQQLAEILKHLGSDNNRKEVVKEKDPTSELLKLPPQVRRKPPTPSSSRKLPSNTIIDVLC